MFSLRNKKITSELFPKPHLLCVLQNSYLFLVLLPLKSSSFSALSMDILTVRFIFRSDVTLLQKKQGSYIQDFFFLFCCFTVVHRSLC